MEKAININGNIKVYTVLPRKWENQDGSIIWNFRSANEQQLFDLGFRDVVRPVLTTYQKYGTLTPADLSNDVFTYPIEDFSQEEIDAYNQAELDTDIYSEEVNNEFAVGSNLFKRIRAIIKRRVGDNTITAQQSKGFRRNLSTIIPLLKDGEIDLAKDDLDAMSPADPEVLSVLIEIRTLVDNSIP